jgi:hypothetical protein
MAGMTRIKEDVRQCISSVITMLSSRASPIQTVFENIRQCQHLIAEAITIGNVSITITGMDNYPPEQ